MKLHAPASILCIATVALGACHQQESADSPGPAYDAQVPKYSARIFFETTSYRLVGPAAHAFSAEGRSLLVSSDMTGVFNAYALPLSGDFPQKLTTFKDKTAFAVSWFPRDNRILYTRDDGGDELDHVFVRELDGVSRDLTPGERLRAEFLGWNKDGRNFYLATTERNQQDFDIYRYSVDDYSREHIYKNPGFQIGDISDSGRWIALVKPRTSADADVYVVDLESTAQKPVLITPHSSNVRHRVYEFTPDERELVYGTDEHGEFSQAWKYNLANGGRSVLLEAPWDVSYVTYSPGGRYRVSAVNADASTEVFVWDTKAEEYIKLPVLPAGELGSVRFSQDETRMALIVRPDDSPPDIHVIDLGADQGRQLTHALNPAINQRHLVKGTVIRYQSFDDLEIPAVLYRPHGASAENSVPALVFVHGGPGGQFRVGYEAMVQHLVNHGYGMLGANNRGSSGYGKTFYHMDDKRHGEEDLQDIVYGKKYLESLDWVDGSRIGVIGGSYGGFLVTAALAFEPEVFAAGIDIFGVTNWVRTLQNMPPWWEAVKESLYDEMGDPATDADRLRRISPLFHTDKIAKPLLVVQGAKDPRVLPVESEELVAALRARNVPVEYLTFPDEGHGFTKRDNRIAASDAFVKFLDTYLKGEPRTAE
jgi:dipeptidyl aminopeptidase/acylaminoacyl peptidase